MIYVKIDTGDSEFQLYDDLVLFIILIIDVQKNMLPGKHEYIQCA